MFAPCSNLSATLPGSVKHLVVKNDSFLARRMVSNLASKRLLYLGNLGIREEAFDDTPQVSNPGPIGYGRRSSSTSRALLSLP